MGVNNTFTTSLNNVKATHFKHAQNWNLHKIFGWNRQNNGSKRSIGKIHTANKLTFYNINIHIYNHFELC